MLDLVLTGETDLVCGASDGARVCDSGERARAPGVGWVSFIATWRPSASCREREHMRGKNDRSFQKNFKEVGCLTVDSTHECTTSCGKAR